MSADTAPDTECPTCGREGFANEAGMKRHHAVAHGESIAGVTITCEVCGDSFRAKPRDEDTARFCSRECKHKVQRKGRIVECECCGEQTYRPPSHSGRFCSNSCMNEAFRGEQHPCYTPITTECRNCGDDFHHRPSRDRSYCSEACMSADFTVRMLADGNPNWAGGKSDYGSGWNESKKKEVRKRDGHQCQSCGMGQSEHIDLTERKLDVHHIIPAKTFDDANRRNAKQNLITLCIWCHQEWEQMAPLRPQPVSGIG